MGIFNIFARMTLDSSQFEAGAKRVESLSAALGKKIGSYFTAGAIGYGLLSLARSAVQAAGDIGDLSEQLSLTTEEVQKLQRVSRLANIDMNKYADVLTKIRKARIDALSGDSKAASLFARLGVSPNANPMDVLGAIGNASTTDQIAASFELIGTKASRLTESLKQINELSPLELITPESQKALDDAADTISDIHAAMRGITGNTLGGLKNFVDLWGGMLREAKNANMERLGAGPGASTFRKIITSPLADIMSFIGWGGGVQVDQAFDKLMESQLRTGPINKPGLLQQETDKQRKIREAREGYNDPLNFGSFRSSTANQRAGIGGFFLGADQTARLDIERQQLQAQKMMADRIDRIEKQVAKITEGA